MLNLAGFTPREHALFIQADINGLKEILGLDLDEFGERLTRAAAELGVDAPDDLSVAGWWDQAKTLEEE
jgi:hypothetical protein